MNFKSGDKVYVIGHSTKIQTLVACEGDEELLCLQSQIDEGVAPELRLKFDKKGFSSKFDAHRLLVPLDLWFYGDLDRFFDAKFEPPNMKFIVGNEVCIKILENKKYVNCYVCGELQESKDWYSDEIKHLRDVEPPQNSRVVVIDFYDKENDVFIDTEFREHKYAVPFNDIDGKVLFDEVYDL